jgi:hypothetical protein
MNDDDANTNPIDRALNLSPYEKHSNIIESVISHALNDSAKEDFTYARSNIRVLVENGSQAIQDLAVIASQSQNPRAYEVLAKLIDSTAAANRHLLDLQEQIRKLDSIDEPTNNNSKVVNNNLFVGTTAELSSILKNLKESSN